jgi:anti-anti-sigma regulatory factor
MKVKYMVHIFNHELDEIPKCLNKITVLDVSGLKHASTVFLHKLLELKDFVVLINLHGQPKQIFEICGLDKVIEIFKNIDEAKAYLKDK